jgi:hypothetical protein
LTEHEISGIKKNLSFFQKWKNWIGGSIKLTKCVCETQMPPRETNSTDSHAYVKVFEKSK